MKTTMQNKRDMTVRRVGDQMEISRLGARIHLMPAEAFWSAIESRLVELIGKSDGDTRATRNFVERDSLRILTPAQRTGVLLYLASGLAAFGTGRISPDRFRALCGENGELWDRFHSSPEADMIRRRSYLLSKLIVKGCLRKWEFAPKALPSASDAPREMKMAA